ncbi:NRAMP family divalent metal transporter [Microvirga thermotolerans]|uniref:Divalent metal cation transporter n=1 Tax=Microvirga thermotolerans TaxID=2651334 RepID=A0A5P9JXB4_9HYPH|nr:divalent metal cation transporter [Microvirga thermotolerans]QFU17482.1 divalent metal cation transporter [Microvirga thermotolerans]
MSPEEDLDPERQSPAVAPKKSGLLKVLGPGLITGASDDDPSGIATYSQAGAQFGYALSWVMLFSFPLMTAAQMISARIGRTTGRGIAGNLRKHYPNWLLQVVVVLLLVANTINLGADLGAMADAVNLLLPGARPAYILLFAGICIYMQVFMQYTRYVMVLKWLTLALFAYFAAVIAVQVDWGVLAVRLLVPRIEWNEAYLTTIVAVLGTTISPYLFFWQSAEEVEDIEAYPRRRRLRRAPEQGKAALHRIEVDTIVGMAFSNLVALAILVTTAASLHAHGITDIATSAQAAEALRPIAGRFAFWVFTIGIVGTGLLAVPVLAGSAAYAIGEARRWPIGFSRRWQEAKAFYATVALATLVGMALTFTQIDPIKALYWSAVLNGIIAVPVMVTMMLMASRQDIMGRFAIRGWLRRWGWISTAVMAIAVLGMFATSL